MGRGSDICTRGSALKSEVKVEGVDPLPFMGVAVEEKKEDEGNGEVGLVLWEVRNPRGRVFERDGEEVLLEERDVDVQTVSAGNADREEGGKNES